MPPPGFVGATVFSAAASTSAEKLSTTNTWSTEDDKPQAEDEKKKKNQDSKLETWDHDGECAEITHPEVVEKVNPKYPRMRRGEAKIMGLVILRSTISDRGYGRGHRGPGVTG